MTIRDVYEQVDYDYLSNDYKENRMLLSDKEQEMFDQLFKKPEPEYSEDWQSEARDRAIAQNGPTGDHYGQVTNGS